MARISRFRKDSVGASGRHPTEVECGYSVTDLDGTRYLQLNTYGSAKRKIPGKVSQTLQLDETTARELVSIIRQAFPQIDGK